MGYPKGIVSESEKVVEHKHPHVKMLFMPILTGLVVLGGGGWLAVLARDLDEPWDMVALIAIGAVGLIALIWLVIAPIARWRTTHFIVTTERVISREGVFKRTGIDIPMNRINSVRFEHSLADRILGCGSLIIESASEQALEYDDIPSVEQVHSAIYFQVSENEYANESTEDA
ncbi:PH domain-containing protein [Haloechinothrix sp. YIM 98757]|uniref:PH domain-containing protein n=1 Tax=Haloechinothrix aidingensis TaxID=2752311 RepID=A0A838AG09_9PSEU|nr:PH domain-containing protein [Haloechinothrix aidingensis]